MKWSYINVGVCFSFKCSYFVPNTVKSKVLKFSTSMTLISWNSYHIHTQMTSSLDFYAYLPQNKTKSKQNKNKQNSWFQFFISWIKISVNISSRCLGDAVIRIVISKVELVGLNMIVWTIHCNLLQSSLKSTRREVTFFFWAQIAPCWCFVLH